MRCAVYTRKSNDEGLQQEFNSLDAQREACEAYVASQRGEGWTVLPDRFDDGGYSGGDLRRPALQRLLDGIRAGQVDCIVIYKIDRLTRSLTDFGRLVEVLEKHRVTFVAVTQALNTSTSMGRLTLNVLLSFAQFEREIAGERIRDKFAASRARGLWVTGPRPFGYHVLDKRLVVHDAEASVIRIMFRRYRHLRSARAVAMELGAAGYLNQVGRPILPIAVARVVRNRLYLGETTVRGARVPNTHPAIVSEKLWREAEVVREGDFVDRRAKHRAPMPALLKGYVFTLGGRSLMHIVTITKGKAYRYYKPAPVLVDGEQIPEIRPLRADRLEAAVLGEIDRFLGPRDSDVASPGPDSVFRSAWLVAELEGLVRRLVERVEIGPDTLTLRLRTGGVITSPRAPARA